MRILPLKARFLKIRRCNIFNNRLLFLISFYQSLFPARFRKNFRLLFRKIFIFIYLPHFAEMTAVIR